MSKVKVRVIGRNAYRGNPVGSEFLCSERDAKVLVAMRRVEMAGATANTYQTRDMVAVAPVSVEVVAPVEPAQADPVEVDAEGVAWDAEIHAANKLKKLDGTWRKRSGARAAE